MLLIEHDQAGIRQRAEDGGACPDHRVDGAGAGALPLVQALALGEAAVQQGHAAGEAGREAVHRLRCQRDLRHQHNPLASQRDGGGQRLQIDLCLAAAGHAVHEKRRRLAGVQRRGDGVDRAFLLGRERRRRARCERTVAHGVAPHDLLADAYQAAALQPCQRGAGAVDVAAQLGQPHGTRGTLQHRQHSATL